MAAGTFGDTYPFQWTQGTVVELEARSTDFDTVLAILAPNGMVIENDDAIEGQTNSRLRYTIESSGTHEVVVTSYQVGETGSYELIVY